MYIYLYSCPLPSRRHQGTDKAMVWENRQNGVSYRLVRSASRDSFTRRIGWSQFVFTARVESFNCRCIKAIEHVQHRCKWKSLQCSRTCEYTSVNILCVSTEVYDSFIHSQAIRGSLMVGTIHRPKYALLRNFQDAAQKVRGPSEDLRIDRIGLLPTWRECYWEVLS